MWQLGGWYHAVFKLGLLLELDPPRRAVDKFKFLVYSGELGLMLRTKELVCMAEYIYLPSVRGR